MKSAAIMLVFLSHQGHWLTGDQGVVTVQHGQADEQRSMVFIWGIGYDDVHVASGRVRVERGKSGAVHITVPAVRVRTPMQLAYRVQLADSGKFLEKGETAIVVYPDDLLAGLGKRLKNQRLAFWPHEDRNGQMVDALVTVKNMRKGQLVFCQLDLGDLKSDPRNQLFLADVLDYLSAKRKPN